MKKKFIIISLTFICLFILYAVFITNVYHKEVKVKSSISVINKQIASLDQILKWYIPFATVDTSKVNITTDKIEYNNSSLSLDKHADLSLWYNVGENNKYKSVVFSVFADTGSLSKITLSYESTLWNKFFPKDEIINNAVASLYNLEDYLANVKKMYGFDIEITAVTDTAFLFTSKVVVNEKKNEAFKELFTLLIKEAENKNFGYNGVRIFYVSPYGNDSTHLFTSIGIVNTQNAELSGNFSLKRMPKNGRLLSAYYQGRLGEVGIVLNALNAFKDDNNITIMAIPFVKLITEGIDLDDNQAIQAKAFLPIF